jgi:CheY-like chemotaxis protein
MHERMKKVLVVEDDISLRCTLSSLLMIFHYDFDIAGNAYEALGMLERNRYDAILTDYRMSGMDGIELIDIIRESTTLIPIILMTGCLDERVLGFSGADACLHKPFSASDLKDSLDLVFRNARGGMDLRSSSGRRKRDGIPPQD